ncbi:hypothetical protein B0J12DRAFT_433835 [Macrophomina phaseolina]|uniref:Uncharacterized protein n=1 Tax=Macrophomina phaseolina TaxID=35725 RepID=A0ABQ8GH98_9PEZI|nr:hypothetical protein B0J12DRAFT_433835 [Macrophomina phaseolina]
MPTYLPKPNTSAAPLHACICITLLKHSERGKEKRRKEGGARGTEQSPKPRPTHTYNEAQGRRGSAGHGRLTAMVGLSCSLVACVRVHVAAETLFSFYLFLFLFLLLLVRSAMKRLGRDTLGLCVRRVRWLPPAYMCICACLRLMRSVLCFYFFFFFLFLPALDGFSAFMFVGSPHGWLGAGGEMLLPKRWASLSVDMVGMPLCYWRGSTRGVVDWTKDRPAARCALLLLAECLN